MDNNKDELIEQITEWLFENTHEFETEHWGGTIEEGVKFYEFKTQYEMIEALKAHLNK